MDAAEFDKRLHAIADDFIAKFNVLEQELMENVGSATEDAVNAGIPKIMIAAAVMGAMKKVDRS